MYILKYEEKFDIVHDAVLELVKHYDRSLCEDMFHWANDKGLLDDDSYEISELQDEYAEYLAEVLAKGDNVDPTVLQTVFDHIVSKIDTVLYPNTFGDLQKSIEEWAKWPGV